MTQPHLPPADPVIADLIEWLSGRIDMPNNTLRFPVPEPMAVAIAGFLRSKGHLK